MSRMDQDDDISDIKKSRQTREEVRRRNREVMQRANAELLESKTGSTLISTSAGNKRDASRLPLIRQFQDGTQSLFCDFKFHSSTPELVFGPLKVDMGVNASDFCDFSAESAASMFNECLRSTCMIDESLLTYLDMVNPEETYRRPNRSDAQISRADEALLINDLVLSTSGSTGVGGTNIGDESGVYTGHFLRKPQLMSNDLFAEGAGGVSRKAGGSLTTSLVGRNRDRSLSPEAFNMIAKEFEDAKNIDRLFEDNELIENPIAKTSMRAKRVLTMIPDDNVGEYNQFKFVDEQVSTTSPLEYFMSGDFCLYEQTTCDFPRRYKKRRHLARSNRNQGENAGDDFFMVKVPMGNENTCRVKPIGSKVLLKKDIRVVGTSHEGDVILHTGLEV